MSLAHHPLMTSVFLVACAFLMALGIADDDLALLIVGAFGSALLLREVAGGDLSESDE